MNYAYSGYRFASSNLLTKTVQPTETWIDKVLAWNPCNPWKQKSIVIPSDEVFVDETRRIIYGHPHTLLVIKEHFVDAF